MKVLDRKTIDWCENESIRVRRELKLYAYDPLPAQRLALHLNIPIMSPTEIPGVEEPTLQALLGEDAGWSAITVPIGEDKHLIIYNPTHATTRYESNVMHELAHLLLGHQPIRLRQLSGGLPTREYRVEDEKGAEYLGGSLQISAKGLDWAFQRGMTHQETAQHFGASLQMVRYRCNMTGRKLI
jgi:Predicted Zn peptidase